MSDMFYISCVEFPGLNKFTEVDGFISRRKILGLSAAPVAPCSFKYGFAYVPPVDIEDFLVGQNSIECYIKGKKQVVWYGDVFGGGDNDICHIIKDLSLNGDFDKSLPMEEEVEEESEDDEWSGNWLWSYVPTENPESCESYWDIVSDHIKKNIKSNILNELSIEVVNCHPVTWNYDGAVIDFNLILCKTINNDELKWPDTRSEIIKLMNNHKYPKKFDPLKDKYEHPQIRLRTYINKIQN